MTANLWPFELADLLLIEKALESVIHNEAGMLYIAHGTVEIKCDDEQVGRFRLQDDAWVFEVDRGVSE